MAPALILPSRFGSASIPKTRQLLTRNLTTGSRTYTRLSNSHLFTSEHPLKEGRKKFPNYTLARYATPSHSRAFTSNPSLQKKKGKDSGESHKKSAIDTAPPDASDFSLFQDAQNALTKHLKDGLAKLDIGGRFNPESVESLKVQVGAKEQKETVRLSDLAQVIPRGRTLNIVAGEKEHIKPISSALLGSSLSLNAQQDPHNPLQLNVPLPAPTTEARQQASAAATKLQENALNAVRQARQTQRNAIQEMRKKKIALADDVTKAEKKLEARVSEANNEVKKIVSDVKKKLERDS